MDGKISILLDEVVILYRQAYGKLSIRDCIAIVKKEYLGTDQSNLNTHNKINN